MSHAERAEIVARTAFVENWEALAHTVRVVRGLGELATDDEQAVAWLHDVVEDTAVKLIDLLDMGFGPVIVDAVRYVTNSDGDYLIYKEFLLRAPGRSGMVARRVKLADARDNLQRCKDAVGVPKWQRLATVRYQPMIQELEALDVG